MLTQVNQFLAPELVHPKLRIRLKRRLTLKVAWLHPRQMPTTTTMLISWVGWSGADPGFLEGGFNCFRRRFVFNILSDFS